MKSYEMDVYMGNSAGFHRYTTILVTFEIGVLLPPFTHRNIDIESTVLGNLPTQSLPSHTDQNLTRLCDIGANDLPAEPASSSNPNIHQFFVLQYPQTLPFQS
jgi:hypothetical protein